MSEFGAFDGQEVMSEVLPKKTIWKRIADGWDKFDKWTDRMCEEHPVETSIALTVIIAIVVLEAYDTGRKSGYRRGVNLGVSIGRLAQMAEGKE